MTSPTLTYPAKQGGTERIERTWPVTATTLSGWGRTNPVRSAVHHPNNRHELEAAAGIGSVIARGSGRSYGDAAQDAGGAVIDTQAVTQVQSFDRTTGIITVDAGITLDTLLRVTVPHGWFIAVTSGTSQVTVGGAIAADIHGKNHHHDGWFCDHVTAMTVRTGRGTEHLTPSGTPSEFWATSGGMGLTGVILDATLQLRPVESPQYPRPRQHRNLESLMTALEAADRAAGYSVAWLDGLATGRRLGRGLVITGGHSTRREVADTPRIADFGTETSSHSLPPVALPIISPTLARGFNATWCRLHHPSQKIVPYQSFFHPLDAVSNWNLLYGRRGFVRWQIVVPDEAGLFIGDALTELTQTKAGSFLSVLKRFGPGNPAPLSVPMKSWTLAVDIPTGAPGDRRATALPRSSSRGTRWPRLPRQGRPPRPVTARHHVPPPGRVANHCNEMDPNGEFQSDLSRRLHLTDTQPNAGRLR